MCTTTLFQHKTCKHIWAIIKEPCGPGMGFSTCENFTRGTVKEPPAIYNTRSRPCPRCEREPGRVCDANAIRAVESMGWGVKWGTGPEREDWGCEVKFRGGCVIL